MKKIALINDLSGFGKCSLAASEYRHVPCQPPFCLHRQDFQAITVTIIQLG